MLPAHLDGRLDKEIGPFALLDGCQVDDSGRLGRTYGAIKGFRDGGAIVHDDRFDVTKVVL
jgi:hypothetical protein